MIGEAIYIRVSDRKYNPIATKRGNVLTQSWRSKSAVFRMHSALTSHGYSRSIKAVRRQRNLGLGHIIRNDYNHFVNSTGTCPSGAPAIRVARSIVSIVVLYRPLFVFLPFLFWPLYCLSLFELHCALNLISTFVFLSLGRYIYLWTTSPRGYHPLSSQCLDTYIVFKYIYYLNLQFLNK
jgi:hypothetical protein